MPRKSFLLRIDQQVYNDLESWAQQEMRSVNGQIEYLLRQALSRYKGKEKQDYGVIRQEQVEKPDVRLD
ncbi:MAG: hypothetical protein KC777_12220 [Cyanobacteria bacterium HKST-UBA02]|nr:hypothetical protein [Cyanobacteria bacterium HKST-UBA02]